MLERLLGHEVTATLAGPDGLVVAASVAGEPPRTRLAWLDPPNRAIIGRIACPPARPSRPRPLVATDVAISEEAVADRVLAIRVADGVAAVSAVLALEEQPDPVEVTAGGIALMRLDRSVAVLGVDALDGNGEPVGRLVGAGIGEVHQTAGRLTGRLGLGHGMAAGFGPGHWVDDVTEAAFEAGYEPAVPGWVPDGLPRGSFHIEPDTAYPSAPPSIVVAWGREPRRVLVRQTPAPLAVPDPGGRATTEVEVAASNGVLFARGRFATLVWESAERAFGVQVVGIEDPGGVAVRVARSL